MADPSKPQPPIGYFIYCGSCEIVCQGRLRFSCTKCREDDTVTLKADIKSWSDLTSEKLRAECYGTYERREDERKQHKTYLQGKRLCSLCTTFFKKTFFCVTQRCRFKMFHRKARRHRIPSSCTHTGMI